jgi:uncharacterized protein
MIGQPQSDSQQAQMDPGQILHQLTFYKRLPVPAIRAAQTRQPAVVPTFIRAIEDYVDGKPGTREGPNPLLLIFHMLGHWREKAAYRPLARLLRCPPEDIYHILGDAITVTSHRVMAAVFDGDPGPLYDIILDRDADQYIRARMCETLAMLTRSGDMSREEAARFLRACYANLEPVFDCFVWNGWQCAVAMLGLAELKPLVKQAFERGSIDGTWLGFEDFENDLERAIADSEVEWGRNGEYSLFGDTVEELSNWYGFSARFEREKRRRVRAEAARQLLRPTTVSIFPKVGRNDPCPCGSGMKFKKCCLN